MLFNDKTIFSYLKPTDNDMITKMNNKDLKEILFYLDKYYLEYRDTLGLGSLDTFGVEIEIEHFMGISNIDFINFYLELTNIVGNKKWDSRNDISLINGREIVSEILTDDIKHWNNIRKVCDFAFANGRIDTNCSAHVHAGSQILGDNSLYWYRFFRLWSIYENVIYRFSYGEYLTYRPNIIEYARPAAKFFDSRLKLLDSKLDYSLLEMLRIVEPTGIDERYTKRFGVSYWRMLADNNYDIYEDFNKINDGCTLELRVPNGTLDEVVWQNYINFFIKMMIYCKSDKYDEDILNRRKPLVEGIFDDISAYSLIYLDQAIEFSDMIFDNNLDKIYFLKQYLKSFQVADKPFVKARKITDTRR